MTDLTIRQRIDRRRAYYCCALILILDYLL